MARARRAVRILILLDVDEVPVEVRDQDSERRTVSMIIVPRAFDGIGDIQAGIDDRQIRLLSWARQLIGPRLSKHEIAVDFLLGKQHSRRYAMHQRSQTLLIRSPCDSNLKTTSKMAT